MTRFAEKTLSLFETGSHKNLMSNRGIVYIIGMV